VVINADASPGVRVDVQAGVRVGWLLPAFIGALVGGLLLLGGGGRDGRGRSPRACSAGAPGPSYRRASEIP